MSSKLFKRNRVIGEAAFAKMKDGVRVINCARGGLVDETALFNAIKSATASCMARHEA